jgi:hypothetical protein
MAAAAAEFTTALGSGQAFEPGLAALLDGIEQRVAAARSGKPAGHLPSRAAPLRQRTYVALALVGSCLRPVPGVALLV